MAKEKLIVGYCTVKKDEMMYNRSFQYAASYEDVLVPAGKYPVVAFKDDLLKDGGKMKLGWRNYIEYEGTVVASNVGGKPGEKTYYCPMIYDYQLAQYFLNGGDETVGWNERHEYELAPEWELNIHEYKWDGVRRFGLDVVLKED